MSKRTAALAAMIFLLAALCGSAGAEEALPATPTDLGCPHAHIKTTIYFFDSPAYTPLDAETHRVFGPAVVETVCEDCGEILSSESVSSAEEIRPHTMKKGACLLCKYRAPAKAEEPKKAPAPTGEETIIAPEDGSAPGLLSVTLTDEELSDMVREGISTVLVRGRSGSAALVLNVRDVLAQAQGVDLYLELAEREDGSVFAGTYLVSPSGKRSPAASGGITLRLYRAGKSGKRVSVAAADTDTLTETRGVWDDRGFWSVPYMNEGTYFILQ